MFDFDIGKLMVVAIVALAVIPPKDLPRVMRTVGQVVGKMRRMAAEFQGQFMDAMREADLENVRKELESLNEKAKVDASFDPAGMIRDEVTKAAAPHDVGTSEVALNPPEPAPPSPEAPAGIEANLENVRGELEALNEKAKAGAPADVAAMIREEATGAAAAHDARMPEVALNDRAAPPHETPEASAKQSAAE
ncbi:MAG TPA: Sec-independent protein translocase protein TatB [Roseiarcus sp.]|jgi:sec-independent protein translocase protein TatB|nr:Sec-independent protein translocase protein TatB [Roseiarcus sp.]